MVLIYGFSIKTIIFRLYPPTFRRMFAPNASSQWDSDSDDDTESLGPGRSSVGRDGKRMGNGWEKGWDTVF